MTSTLPATTAPDSRRAAALREIEQRILWLSTATTCSRASKKR
ncbi:hypothetical protein QRX60_30040 [Amycolatopsis mongoliensis]|uniref:Uncharacterized protein n=1 Tax=Amycolatopsis mongoliensis TaxID=715475 RepID=A0A9Y2JJ82_9PSEU|nr:hypothetical protein [Amycolatopsis sp. 4-36]WIX98298.1 hypothetical protein QRX60_30040 [Amycolatopsis sp. 4-36]